ncbi:unnamed protein product, partial [Iphiclides podalirius]
MRHAAAAPLHTDLPLRGVRYDISSTSGGNFDVGETSNDSAVAVRAYSTRYADGARQCAGGSGLRRLCLRSPLVEDPACSANDFVFMALILLQVLVLGVTAAAVDGAFYVSYPQAPRGPARQRAVFTAADACASLVCVCRSNTAPNYGGSISICGPTSKFSCRPPWNAAASSRCETPS